MYKLVSSSQDSHGSTIATTPPHSSALPSDQVHEVVFDALNNWLTQTLVPTLQTMGVGIRSPTSVASSGASHVPPICDPTIEAHQVERAERDDDEDEDPHEGLASCWLPTLQEVISGEPSPNIDEELGGEPAPR
ncbi:hypothetical protein Taro_029613 [Colocasia esculenta]|uniref:Uncharacterized protein n=1 Tax=Colocasia esculenta TaxID=4460 RepID=A0A843VRM9_COLES|nr:hypothetical protein [Colocasia esculenta]